MHRRRPRKPPIGRCDFGFGMALCLALMILVIRPGPAARSADEPKAAGQGRITLYAWFEDEADGNGVIVVDPATDSVEKVFDIPHVNGPISLADFKLSPDGRRVAYALLKSIDSAHCGEDSVWLRDLRPGGQPRKISYLRGWPIWSGDGKKLLVCEPLGDKNPEKVSKYAVWTIDDDGSHAARLPIPDNLQVEDWSSDGQWIVGAQVGPDRPQTWENWQIVVMHPDGTGRKTPIEPGEGDRPRFAPNGRHLAFFSSKIDRGEGRSKGKSIEVVDLDGKGRRRVYDEPTGGQINGLTWSPDGKRLATVVSTWVETKDSTRLGNPRLCLIDLADGKSRFVPHRRAKVLGIPQWR